MIRKTAHIILASNASWAAVLEERVQSFEDIQDNNQNDLDILIIVKSFVNRYPRTTAVPVKLHGSKFGIYIVFLSPILYYVSIKK